MSNTYNQVTPIVLGQQRKLAKTNKNPILSSDSNVTSHSIQPPFPTTSGVLLMGNVENQTHSSITDFPGSSFSSYGSQPYKFNGDSFQVENKRRKHTNSTSSIYNADYKSSKSYNHNNYNMKSHILGLLGDNPEEEEKRRRKRAERFNLNNTNNGINNNNNSSSDGNITNNNIKNTYDVLNAEDDIANLNAISSKSQYYDKNIHIVGRCQKLEKSYLRLTSEPNPELVRPLPVLCKAFNLLMEKEAKNEVSYAYLCDQLKAIRQDMRVQMIENRFTMKVYQTHARLALKHGDLGEFNQCQSRLLHLYKDTSLKKVNFDEFMSYLVLYYMVTNDNAAINALRLELLTEYRDTFKQPLVVTSFQLADAQLTNNYKKFMTIYASMKGLGKCLVSAFIERELLKALNTMCMSYNQLNLGFLTEELKFEACSGVPGGVLKFLCEKGLDKYVVTKNAGQATEFRYLDAKSCRGVMLQLYLNSRKVDIKGQK